MRRALLVPKILINRGKDATLRVWRSHRSTRRRKGSLLYPAGFPNHFASLLFPSKQPPKEALLFRGLLFDFNF